MRQTLLLILIAGLVAACQLPRRVDRPAPAPPAEIIDVQVVDPIAHAEAARRARQQILAADRRRARERLADAQQTTNLADPQLDDLRAAETALARGDHAEALHRLERLEAAVEDAVRTLRVRPGDSLWRIAARPEVYGNGLMWPLIWEANRNQLRSPELLRVGQLLKIRSNPTVEEVVQAIATAKQRLQQRVTVGPITEVE